MAVDKFDPREAERFEEEYRRQFDLLSGEVKTMETRIESIPREIRELRDKETELKTELLQTQQKLQDVEKEERTIRNDLAGKRRMLDDMTNRHHQYERNLKKAA